MYFYHWSSSRGFTAFQRDIRLLKKHLAESSFEKNELISFWFWFFGFLQLQSRFATTSLLDISLFLRNTFANFLLSKSLPRDLKRKQWSLYIPIANLICHEHLDTKDFKEGLNGVVAHLSAILKNYWLFFCYSWMNEYRKIPKISPEAYIFQRPFLRGLFSEGLIIGGGSLPREICFSKSIGLAWKLEVNQVPFFLFFTLYLRAIFQVQAPEGLIFGGTI